MYLFRWGRGGGYFTEDLCSLLFTDERFTVLINVNIREC